MRESCATSWIGRQHGKFGIWISICVIPGVVAGCARSAGSKCNNRVVLNDAYSGREDTSYTRYDELVCDWYERKEWIEICVVSGRNMWYCSEGGVKGPFDSGSELSDFVGEGVFGMTGAS